MLNNQQPISLFEKLDIFPKKFIKIGVHNSTKETIAQSSPTPKPTLQYEFEQDSEDLCGFEDGESFSKDKVNCF
jgi:hypothetical protein